MTRTTTKQLDAMITALGIKIGELIKSNETTKKEIFTLCRQMIRHQQILTARLDQQAVLLNSLLRPKSEQQRVDSEMDRIIGNAMWNSGKENL